MHHRSFLLAICLLAGLIAPGAPRAQGIIFNIQLSSGSFSPNGNGVQDTTFVTYELADTATSVLLAILEDDSATVVDTLFSGASAGSADVMTFPWDGRDFTGAPVAEDSFVVLLRAVNAMSADSVYRKVKVDVTPPQAIISNVFPTVFGPGSPDPSSTFLTIEYEILDAPPSTVVRAEGFILDPAGENVETFILTDIAANTSHTHTWDGGTATDDGLYDVVLTVIDRAGNTAMGQWTFSVDLDMPTVEITSPPASPPPIMTVPDSLFGFAYDRSGIDPPLLVRYRSGDQFFEPITNTRTSNDTVYYAVQLIDSLSEGSFNLGIRAFDTLGRSRTVNRTITIDTTAPPAPVVMQPSSPTANPKTRINATFTADAQQMRIFLNGAEVATILPSQQLPYDVTLRPGSNTIYATALDNAGNESPPSNQVVVVFDNSVAFNVPQPFRPNDTFQLNLPQPATVVRIHLYDLGGNPVETLQSSQLSASIEIPWSGLNRGNEIVNRGPLVAVVEAVFEDGTSKIGRQVFLFSP